MDLSGRSPDPRRAGARILDTAEGVLIALRGCSLNQAFVEIVQTAKSHNVSTLSLADALVAIAQTQAYQDIDDAAFAAARATWGHLLDRTGQGPAVRPSPPRLDGNDDDEVVSGA
jgi:ANTAR domain